jgi:hypothetical protein
VPTTKIAAAAAAAAAASLLLHSGGGGCRQQELSVLPTQRQAADDDKSCWRSSCLSSGCSQLTFDSCKRTTKCKMRRLLQLQPDLLLGCCQPRLPPATSGYLLLSAAICGRGSGSCFSSDPILKLLYKNSCL